MELKLWTTARPLMAEMTTKKQKKKWFVVTNWLRKYLPNILRPNFHFHAHFNYLFCGWTDASFILCVCSRVLQCGSFSGRTVHINAKFFCVLSLLHIRVTVNVTSITVYSLESIGRLVYAAAVEFMVQLRWKLIELECRSSGGGERMLWYMYSG